MVTAHSSEELRTQELVLKQQTMYLSEKFENRSDDAAFYKPFDSLSPLKTQPVFDVRLYKTLACYKTRELTGNRIGTERNIFYFILNVLLHPHILSFLNR
jgi:hypothetical protein